MGFPLLLLRLLVSAASMSSASQHFENEKRRMRDPLRDPFRGEVSGAETLHRGDLQERREWTDSPVDGPLARE
jgi:hypothetical protein